MVETEQQGEVKRVIAICGETGAGKSSLINAEVDAFLRALECKSVSISVPPGCDKSTIAKDFFDNPSKRDHDPVDEACDQLPGKVYDLLKLWKQKKESECFLRAAFPKARLEECFKRAHGPLYLEDMPSNLSRAKQKLISGVHGSGRGNNSIQVFKMEHSALQGPNSQWNLEVKYKLRENKGSANRWVNISNFYPDAKVEPKRNGIELTISSPNEDHEFAVFGTPGTDDKKRMQIGIFGGKPTQGKHWQIFVTLFDDTMMAFKRVREREERKGRQLLTTLAGLFVANSDEDIKIGITGLEDGWEKIGSHFMTIKSKEAWNSPENSTDFPCCVFEIAHVDKTKQTFFCGIQASHLNDTAETELVAFFEQEQENEEDLDSQKFIPPPERLTIKEDYFIEVLEKAIAPRVYERNGWESLATVWRLEPLPLQERFDGKKGGLYDLLLQWKQEQAEAFVSFLMMVFFVGCPTGTRFVIPHLLKVEETEGRVLLS